MEDRVDRLGMMLCLYIFILVGLLDLGDFKQALMEMRGKQKFQIYGETPSTAL